MKSKTEDKFLAVRKLVRKLGDLALVLDDVSKKMNHAVEKQRATLANLREPNANDRRVLNNLHKKLEAIEQVEIEEVEIQKAHDLSNKLIERNSRSKRASKMTYHEYVEFTGIEEFRKFREMPALTENDIVETDWDEFYERLATES